MEDTEDFDLDANHVFTDKDVYGEELPCTLLKDTSEDQM